MKKGFPIEAMIDEASGVLRDPVEENVEPGTGSRERVNDRAHDLS